MTGYGYNEFLINNVKFFITIKSVNSKYLDININLPFDLQYMEEPLNKTIKNLFERGKLDVYVGVDKSTLAYNLELNENLLEGYIKLQKKINKKIKTHNKASLSDIVNFSEIIIVKQNQAKIKFSRDFKKKFLIALNQLKEMRQIEGKSIYDNFIKILNNMDLILKKVNKLLPGIILDYEKKLKLKIQHLINTKSYDENRILMEVALLSDKMDINEEIERMKSHITEMKKYLNANKPCGKLMEFLLQEMLRETNAIGSKVSNIDVTRDVIVLKDSIEQMREQARNAE